MIDTNENRKVSFLDWYLYFFTPIKSGLALCQHSLILELSHHSTKNCKYTVMLLLCAHVIYSITGHVHNQLGFAKILKFSCFGRLFTKSNSQKMVITVCVDDIEY